MGVDDKWQPTEIQHIFLQVGIGDKWQPAEMHNLFLQVGVGDMTAQNQKITDHPLMGNSEMKGWHFYGTLTTFSYSYSFTNFLSIRQYTCVSLT